MGDWSGFMDKIHEVVPMDQQPELLQKLSEGNFTLRIMYEQFQNILKMGPIGQVILIPLSLASIFCCPFVLVKLKFGYFVLMGVPFNDSSVLHFQML